MNENETASEEQQLFDATFHQLVADLPHVIDDAESAEWLRRCLLYCVPGGKQHRGRMVVETFQRIRGGDGGAGSDASLARILGWLIEIFQAYLLVADDIVDYGQMRRGRPCWHRVVGLTALNDSFLLEHLTYALLKRHFGTMPCYSALVDTFRDVSMKTVVGQCMDLMANPPAPIDSATNAATSRIDFDSVSEERYLRMIEHKTAWYSFCLPVRLGLLLAGVDESSPTLRRAEAILLRMGEYYQIQDDFLDCFVASNELGKVGTDIENGKFSWLLVKALHAADGVERQELETSYGRSDAESVARVRALYERLELRARFDEYEKEAEAQIRSMIEESCGGDELPASIFYVFWSKIARRRK